ncbi:Yip1 family protein [Muricoccus radiodurans]|uniref:Yip1 family protein n=1 Tax=Muricoccus radiodurans TaxID=2231721 RepID=UPI003CF5D87F
MDIAGRAKGLILNPRTEWMRIAPEGGLPMDHFRGYAVPMAAIPVICNFIGSLLLGGMLAAAGVGRPGIVGALLVAVVSYVLSLVGVIIIAKLVETLAPSFGGTADPLSAMKLAVYSPTASWLAGIFALIPFLGFLAILGLYSIYIYWVGVPIVTRVPEDRRLGFTAVLVICAIVINIIIGALAGIVVGLAF